MRTSTWTAAAKIALERNTRQKWSCWDDADNFDYTPESMLRFCVKEDERLAVLALAFSFCLPDQA